MIKTGIIGYGFSSRVFHLPFIEEKEYFGTLYDGERAVRVETEAGCYQQYYSAFFKAIRKGWAYPVSGEEALNVIKILELAGINIRDGKTVTN